MNRNCSDDTVSVSPTETIHGLSCRVIPLGDIHLGFPSASPLGELFLSGPLNKRGLKRSVISKV